MHLLFVIDSLVEAGGAERAFCILANELANRGHEITILTLFQDPDFYPLDSRIHRCYLNNISDKNATTRSRSICSIFKRNFDRLKNLRKIIIDSQSKIIISFMDYCNSLCPIAALGLPIKIIGSEQNNPRFLNVSKLANWARRLIYRRLNLLVCCSHGVKEEFSWLPHHKKTVIYNPLTPSSPPYPRPSMMEPSKKWILATGRLNEQKGFARLIKIFATLANDFSEWQLLILGEGEQRQLLETLIRNFKLENRVFLPGRVKDIFAYYHASDFFVLSSYHEGFGNVLIEAMSSGLPVISFDCPSGPSEIIRDEKDGGLLISNNDTHAFAVAMQRFMSDDRERKLFAARAIKSSQRFEMKSITTEWEHLINKV